MKRLLLPLVGMLAVGAIAVAPAAAATGAHYNKGPTATVQDNSLTVTFKAVGLGNTVTSAEFTLTGTATVESQCFTKSGNPVQGVPKQETVDVNADETFPVRNGSVNGVITVSPLSTLTCTGNQHVEILSVSFDLLLGNDVGIEPNPFPISG